jgi:hypothetical protein
MLMPLLHMSTTASSRHDPQKNPPMKHVCLALMCFGLLVSTQAWAVDPLLKETLENVFREKGVISKEDWMRIQASKEQKEEEIRKRMDAEFPIAIGYGRSGFELKSRDGQFGTHIQWGFQGRWSYPERNDSFSFSDFHDDPESTFELRRVRMKVGGHGYEPWVKY